MIRAISPSKTIAIPNHRRTLKPIHLTITMAPHDLYVDRAWDWTITDPSKPEDQRSFEGYAHAVTTRTFGDGLMTNGTARLPSTEAKRELHTVAQKR
ncbi:hypothetical protein BBD39_05635 [Arsenophonus endosymbiont of Bemisia tabaci Asia II 3]|nr:hypothetical protein BBD39_05635 [Arsenophonus endosymbiont of Bemisia tabaci Asia II 3]